MSYNATNLKVKGAKCMVFPDKKKPEDGSRYFHGEIVDVIDGLITVEVTESTYHQWKKHDQLFFPPFQVYAFAEQLKLF